MTTTRPSGAPEFRAADSETPDFTFSRLAACAALIAAFGILVYANSFQGQIVFDDLVIEDDPSIRQLWPPWESMLSPSQIARPLVGLSLAINYAISGVDLWSYHLFNLTIHILAGLALFGVVRRTLLTERLRNRFGRASTALAVAITLIWLVHPLNTQSVTYLIQRSEAMVGLFYLLTLYCAIRTASSMQASRWFAAAVASCAAGMATKPVMVTAPLVVLIYDRIFLSGSLKEVIRRRAILYVGLASTWLILGLVLAASSPTQRSAGFSLVRLTPFNYLASQFGVIVHYLQLAFWPYGLCLDYGWPVAESPGEIAPYAAAVGLLAVLALVALKRKPELGFPGVWFFLILAPTSSVFPILDLAVEHRMYLPLMAVVALVVLPAYRVAPRLLPTLSQTESSTPRWVAFGALAVLVAWLGSLTVERNAYYHSKMSIWLDVVRKRPDNPRGHSNLGLYLASQGALVDAINEFGEALRLNPNHPDALNNMGMALANSGKRAEAIPYFQRALELRPDIKQAHFNLGQVLASQDRLEEAVVEYREEIRTNPQATEARMQLASALERRRRFDQAAGVYRDALAVFPNWPEPLCRMALLLTGDEAGHLRDANEAVRLAEKAVAITQRQPVALDVLASVYSSTGRFGDAVAAAQEAAERARSAGAEELASSIEVRLQDYKRGRPARPE